MTRILFADHDFPDIELERSLFAGAGLELVSRNADGRPGDRGRARLRAILLQYAPITARVVRRSGLGIVSRIGAGLRHGRHGRVCAPRHMGGQFAGLRRGRGRHARVRPRSASMRTSLRYDRDIRAGRWHYLSAGELRRPSGTHARNRGTRTHRQAAWPTSAATSSRRSWPATRYIIDGDFPAYVERANLHDLFAASDMVSLHAPLNAETRGMIDAE